MSLLLAQCCVKERRRPAGVSIVDVGVRGPHLAAVCIGLQTLPFLFAALVSRHEARLHPARLTSHTMLNIVAILLTLTAAFSYLNHRYLKWPMTIGVMAIALAVSLAVIGLDQLGFATPRGHEHALLTSFDFKEVLMQGMLLFLLFAGALHVDLNQLRRVAWQVGVLPFVGTELSTMIIGFVSWHLLAALGIAILLSYCLLFGALILPTDTIAVLGLLNHGPAHHGGATLVRSARTFGLVADLGWRTRWHFRGACAVVASQSRPQPDSDARPFRRCRLASGAGSDRRAPRSGLASEH